MNISFVIPCHNEAENIVKLIPALEKVIKKHKWNAEILVVNDNSSDNTRDVAEGFKYENIKVINRTKGNNGMGYALKEGTEKAKGDVIIWTMGDFSDNIDTYKLLIDKIKKGYDFVIASRYVKGGSPGDNLPAKRVFSWLYPKFARLRYGIKLNEVTNSFRAFKKSVYEKIKLVNNDFSIAPEFTLKACRAGFKVSEVPTTYKNREKGKAKFNIHKMGPKYLRLMIRM